MEQAVLTEVRVLVKGLWGMETLVQTDSPNIRDRAQFLNAVPFLFANTKMIFDILILGDYLRKEVKRESFDENNKIQTPTVSASAALTNSWRTIRLK